MDSSYFYWLVGLIGDPYIGENYQKLLWKLYCTEYIWELDFDKNRAIDGLQLRDIFAMESGSGSHLQGGCSVLEMMVALARKAENDIMHDPDFGDRSGIWFWQIMENLGLDVYDDFGFFESEVERILDIFMHHRYAPDGNGGAFPCYGITRDMRKTDLWWQMNVYLGEHYMV